MGGTDGAGKAKGGRLGSVKGSAPFGLKVSAAALSAAKEKEKRIAAEGGAAGGDAAAGAKQEKKFKVRPRRAGRCFSGASAQARHRLRSPCARPRAGAAATRR